MLNPFLPTATLQLKGKDALDLLHRISTVNVKSLPLKEPCAALILNPQGKIECGFTLTKISEDTAHLTFDEPVTLPESHEKKIRNLLDHYTFGEKYVIEKITPSQTHSPLSELQRIRELSPQIGHEWLPNGETNPLEINLSSSIHDQKGCYPGQEIIEKIIALGSPPRRLCLLKQTGGNIIPLEKVSLPLSLTSEDADTVVGSLTSLALNEDNTFSALGILKRTHSKPNLTVKAANLGVFTIEKVSS